MKHEVLDHFEDEKIKQRKTVLLLVFLLVYLRAYVEIYLIQTFEFMIRCTFAGCFLKFNYQLILEVLSLAAFFLLGRQHLNFKLKKSIVTSILFVIIFMLTSIYSLLGRLFDFVILQLIFDIFEFDHTFYWSMQLFLGIIISMLIMAVFSKRIKLNRTIGKSD